MFEIRPFRNSDLPRLAALWVEHHSVHRPAPAVTPKIWEQAIAARHFFAPERLLVATAENQPLAWCQWFIADGVEASLAAFCFDPLPAGEQAAAALLDELQQQVAKAGLLSITAGIAQQSRFGYQGLDPVGHGFGIDVADDRTNQLLEQRGFEEIQRIDRWEIETRDYRPPINRQSLSMGRGTRIEAVTVPLMCPAESAAMFHFDIQRYHLLGADTIPLASIDLWLSDPDVHVMELHQAILGEVSSATVDPTAREAAIRYLIGQTIPMLGAKHIRSISRSVQTDEVDEAARLAALKFHRTAAGRLLRKRL